jgi:hypothetical protein
VTIIAASTPVKLAITGQPTPGAESTIRNSALLSSAISFALFFTSVTSLPVFSSPGLSLAWTKYPHSVLET